MITEIEIIVLSIGLGILGNFMSNWLWEGLNEIKNKKTRLMLKWFFGSVATIAIIGIFLYLFFLT